MELMDCLQTECIQIGTEARDKPAALEAIAHLASRHPLLNRHTPEHLRRALADREAIGSTGFGKGIAVPHCALPDIDGFAVGVLAVPDGLEFDSLDGEPTRLLVFIVGPESKRNEHVTLLSAISRILDNDEAVKELLAQTSPEALRESFLRHHTGHVARDQQPKCLFHVFIQREDVFSEILQIFSGTVAGDISVIEGHTSGSYLHRLPMFAAFWNDQQRDFCRIVIAVVDKPFTNDVIRRINLAVNDFDRQSGVLVTVQDLLLVRGALDF